MSTLLRLWRRPAVAPPHPTPAPVWRSTHRSHVGRVRLVNEDRVLDRPDRSLWAVADGMGGHSAGDRAAMIAVDTLDRLADRPDPITADAIMAALEQANAAILATGVPGRSGTTVVVAWADGPFVRLFWAGDSRAYLLRGDRAVQLTYDHSYVQELVDAGALSPIEAERHPQANVITRALGIDADLRIDTADRRTEPGDVLLLCTDGLSRSLCSRDFLSVPMLDALADRLMTNALRRDGGDNVSLILAGLHPGG